MMRVMSMMIVLLLATQAQAQTQAQQDAYDAMQQARQDIVGDAAVCEAAKELTLDAYGLAAAMRIYCTDPTELALGDADRALGDADYDLGVAAENNADALHAIGLAHSLTADAHWFVGDYAAGAAAAAHATTNYAAASAIYVGVPGNWGAWGHYQDARPHVNDATVHYQNGGGQGY